MTNAQNRVPELRIGCSGWNYKSWRGRFYPAGLAPAHWLPFYATVFDTVEANGTFYKLPEKKTFAKWAAATPPGFVVAVKASRYLTHLKRLLEPEEPLHRLLTHARGLGSQLGPVLYQLPPQLRRDHARLDRFVRGLPRRLPGRGAPRLRHVIEFRDPSWYVEDTFALLAEHDVSLCLHDKQGSALTGPLVGPAVYVRFHGTSGNYHGGYGRTALDAWARRLVTAWRDGRDVYAYFNNDPDAVATRNAQSLKRRIAALQ